MARTLSRLSLLIIISSTQLALAGQLKAVSGTSLVTSQPVKFPVANQNKNGTVVVFLSAKCPCSDSHVSLLKQLAQRYKTFQFIGVHANADEPAALAQSYFKKASLGFEVISDPQQRLADSLRAFKTPHAFVLDRAGQIMYQGGVTDSSKADRAERFYLDEALQDITSGQPVRTAEGRTLGCVILRESETR